MKIKIQHNNKFENNTTLESRLENYIKDKFPIAYIISKSAPIYLLGGAIRDLILAKESKDLDFIVLGNEYSNSILEIFQKYNINFAYNRFGGYKINYHGTQIDLWTNNDLYSAIQYNVDGLFFYLNDNILLSFTFDDFKKNGLRLINKDNNIEKGRKEKLIQFEQNFKKIQNNNIN